MLMRVEYHETPGKPPRVAYWQIKPEYVQRNIDGDAQRCECVVKGYKTVNGDPADQRELYHECDGKASLTKDD